MREDARQQLVSQEAQEPADGEIPVGEEPPAVEEAQVVVASTPVGVVVRKVIESSVTVAELPPTGD